MVPRLGGGVGASRGKGGWVVQVPGLPGRSIVMASLERLLFSFYGGVV